MLLSFTQLFHTSTCNFLSSVEHNGRNFGDQTRIGGQTSCRGRLSPGEWRLHPEVVRSKCERFGPVEVDLFLSRETRPSSPLGLDAIISPDCSAPGSPAEGPWDGDSPVLAGPSMVSRYNITPGRPSLGDPPPQYFTLGQICVNFGSSSIPEKTVRPEMECFHQLV